MADSKTPNQKLSLSIWAKLVMVVVVFCGTAFVASYILKPAWLVERRLKDGNLTEEDVEAMHANVGGYIHMTGNAMLEAAQGGNTEVLFRLSEFMLGTLEDMNPHVRSDHAPMAGWIHLAAARQLDEADLVPFLSQIGATSDVRVEVLCTAFERFSEGERGPALGPEVLRMLSEGPAGPSGPVHDIALLRCRPGLVTALAVWVDTTDSTDTAALVGYLGGLISLAGVGVLDSAVRDQKMTPRGVLNIIEALHTAPTLATDGEDETAAWIAIASESGALAAVLDFVTGSEVLGRASWFEPFEPGGTEAALHILDRAAELTTPLERYGLTSRFLLAAPEEYRELARARFSAASDAATEVVLEHLRPGLDGCISTVEPGQAQDIVIHLQPGGGAVVTAAGPPELQTCLSQGLPEVNLPGQDRLSGELVIEYP